MPDIGMFNTCNVFQFPRSNVFQTPKILHTVSLIPRQPFHPFQQLKSFTQLPNSHTCPLSTTSSCPGATTPVAPESVFLSLHCLNKEAKSMKNGLRWSHPSKLGMLSSAFIHFYDLSSIWHLVSLAKLFLGSHGIRHL